MQYIDRFTIPTWAIAALEYGDFSGLDDMDTELVQAFIDANCKVNIVRYGNDSLQIVLVILIAILQ